MKSGWRPGCWSCSGPKGLTRHSDELARRRQELPWVRIDKEYRFATDEGSASLADLFRGRSQLLVYHFMFGPDYAAGCPSCSAIADGFNGFAAHLANHDVMLWAVSRAPLAKLQAYKRRMGWTFPWASSFGSDFNFDFNVSVTEEQQRDGVEYNYQREAPVAGTPSRPTPDGAAKGAAMTGTDVATYARERPGMSAFVLRARRLTTYSAYARGDGLWGAYQWLDGLKGRKAGLLVAPPTSTPSKARARAEARLQALADVNQSANSSARSPASRAFRPYIKDAEILCRVAHFAMSRCGKFAVGYEQRERRQAPRLTSHTASQKLAASWPSSRRAHGEAQ